MSEEPQEQVEETEGELTEEQIEQIQMAAQQQGGGIPVTVDQLFATVGAKTMEADFWRNRCQAAEQKLFEMGQRERRLLSELEAARKGFRREPKGKGKK